MAGGLGDDTYFVGSTAHSYQVYSRDIVFERDGEGTDSVIAYDDYTLPANVENLTLSGVKIYVWGANLFALNGTGNSLDNVIIGNSGNNVIDGGAGADTMAGGGK